MICTCVYKLLKMFPGFYTCLHVMHLCIPEKLLTNYLYDMWIPYKQMVTRVFISFFIYFFYGFHPNLTIWVNKVASEKKTDRWKNPHSLCRLGRPEKLGGIVPVSWFLERSLRSFIIVVGLDFKLYSLHKIVHIYIYIHT